MMTKNLTDKVIWIGALNPQLKVFDIVLRTENGTTYNSYLILADKITVVDTVFRKFTDDFIDKIKSHVNPKDISYLVVNHTEMDHSSAIGRLLKEAPNIKIVSTKTANMFLKEILNSDFDSIIVKDGDSLDLGNMRLKFTWVPFWHWPDTMFTYLEEERLLFSCDGFSSHYCDERLFDDVIKFENFSGDFELYFDFIMRPYKAKIREGLKKIEGLDIKIICPSHGPILRTDVKKYIDLYYKWSAPKEGKKKMTIFYASVYGNTKRMAEAIGEGASQFCEVKICDVTEKEPEEFRDDLESSEGIIFGSATLNADAVKPIWCLLSMFSHIEAKGKKVAAFGSYGWSGEAVKLIEERLNGLRLNVVESGLKAVFTPTRADLDRCKEFGANFATSL